ncbi:unnamed protein product [Caenorhabditis brenneri]
MLPCWLEHYFECSAQNVIPENFSQMELKAIPIINTIHWYQPTGSHILDIYEYLVRHGRGEVAVWARWILNRVPKPGKTLSKCLMRLLIVLCASKTSTFTFRVATKTATSAPIFIAQLEQMTCLQGPQPGVLQTDAR